MVDLADDEDAVVAALAIARIGGVVTATDSPTRRWWSSAGSSCRRRAVPVVRGEPVSEPDLEWDVMIRAGRTDPAAVEVLDPGAAYSPERSVAEQLELLAGTLRRTTRRSCGVAGG